MFLNRSRALWTKITLLALALSLATAISAQEEPPELATLLDALEVPLCAEFSADALLVADTNTPARITPADAVDQTVLVFDLSSLDRDDMLDLIRFESKDAVAAKAAEMPVQAYDDAIETDTAGSLYGWLTVFYDADGAPLCRTTAYPAIGGGDAPLALVSFQGFIAQMVSSARLDTQRYQADAFCSFDTPQYCEAIFMGDDRDESITGTEGSDLISGAGGNDTLDGRAGDDVIDGGDGNDVIIGGAGSDFITGGDGDDVIIGGDGDDIIRAGGGNDSVEGQAGLDTLDGGTGVDTVNQ